MRRPGITGARSAVVAVLVAGVAMVAAADPRATLAERITRLTRTSIWTQVAATPVRFKTHHPQGMVKIGERFIVSAVEVRVPTRRFAIPDRYDRDTGEGVGHLFAMDAAGNLITDLTLGEGAIYHPGGIDYDGRNVWVSVAEYRPNSRSIVYRVDPATMKTTEMFRFDDHLGAIVHNTDDNSLHAASWGSRRFYRWTLDREGRVTNANAAPETVRTLNPSHYVDYQDCKYVGGGRMLCTGVAELRRAANEPAFRLGGIDLVDLRDRRPIHQVPLLLWTPGGLDLTHNPVWLEPHGSGVRGYFMPDDDRSTLYVYDVEP